MDKPLWVERTKPANPSKLGVFLACRLRYVFETERPVLKRIGDHPSALMGTAVHDAAEVLRRTLPVEASSSVSVLEQCIGRLVSHDSSSRQLIAWVLGRYGKNALLPREALHESVLVVPRRCAKLKALTLSKFGVSRAPSDAARGSV